ncbi:MAG: hypothetical protein RIS36_953 [Pseudomonadota bacterium]
MRAPNSSSQYGKRLVRWITVCVATVSVATGVMPSAYALPPPPEVTNKSFHEDFFTPRKPIPYSLLGVNSFLNDARFGSIRSQLRDVTRSLGIKKVRVLVAWNDQVQPSPSAVPNFGLYDQIISTLPAGTEALVILTGAPSWVKDSRNWVGGSPRSTFVELWVKKVANRYRTRSRVGAYQIWNEPNNPDFSENKTLDVLTKPANYVELLALAHAAVKSISPRKRVVNGATTAIAQNFPATLNYNKAIVSAGVLNFTDVYAIHFYGKSVERVLLPGGVAEFVNKIPKPIWVTETGAQGVTKQLEYAERIFPFLKKNMPGIVRIYIYQYTESSPATSTYGLRNLTPGATVSDLYIKLRDRPK